MQQHIWTHSRAREEIYKKPPLSHEIQLIQSPNPILLHLQSSPPSPSKTGLWRVWNQIRAERKPKNEEMREDDYLIRGEPNQWLRWGLTLVIAQFHVVRIFYFAPGYFLMTSVFGMFYLESLYQHLFGGTLCAWEASDFTSIVHLTPDGRLSHFQPCIDAFFSNKLPEDLFYSLVQRVLEFKFWYCSTKFVVLALSLTWFPLIKCSSYCGLSMLLGWIIMYGKKYVRAMASVKKSPVIVRRLSVG